MHEPFGPTGKLLRVVFASLIAMFFYHASFAQSSSAEDFIWEKDRSTGGDIALSRNDESFNFFDVGDLAPYSLPLVQQSLGKISNATGERIDRSLDKSSSIAVFHDTNVFSRLRNDNHSFNVLGIPDNIIEGLKQRLTDDVKCITMTVSDNQNNIKFTIILLSQKSEFDSCLVAGLLNSFGVATSGMNTAALMSACVLYEGRRIGIRSREDLSRESAKLRDLCLAKIGREN